MRRIRFRIHYRRRAAATSVLALILLAVASVLVALAVRRTYAGASSRQVLQSAAVGTRHFYVTRMLFKADEAPTACAPGYHFASLWEIADPSNLEYDTSLGLTSPDSGSGPPTAIHFLYGTLVTRGWVRTGRFAGTLSTAGQANCNAWTSDSGSHGGTTVNLPSDWTAGEQDVGVWNADTRTCDSAQWVWCAQDSGPWRRFLPLILK